MDNKYYKIDGKKTLYGVTDAFTEYLREHDGVAPQIPEGVEMLGDNIFKENTDIREIELPSTCLRIGWHAFLDCANLERVFMNEGLEEIRGSAFSGCPSIKKLYIPESIKSIRENAFKYCTGLQRINFFDKLHIDNTVPEDNDEQKIRPFAHPYKILETIDGNIVFKTKDNFHFKAVDRDEFIRVPISELRDNVEDGYVFIKSMKVYRYYDFKEKYEELKENGEKVFLPNAVFMINAYKGTEENVIRFGKNLNVILRQATISKGKELNTHEKECLFNVAYGMGLYEDDESTRTKGANAIKQYYLEGYKVIRNEDGTETKEKISDGLDFRTFMAAFGNFKMKPYNAEFTKVFLNNTYGVEHISRFLEKPLKEQKKLSYIFNNFEKILVDYDAYKTTCKGEKEFDLYEYCFNYKDISKFGDVPEDRVELAEKIAPYYNTEQDFIEVCEIVDKSVAPYICLPRDMVISEPVTYMANSLTEHEVVSYEINADIVEANEKTISKVEEIIEDISDKELDSEFTYLWVPKTEISEVDGKKRFVGNVDNLTVSSIIGTCCTLERVGRAILYNTAWGQNTQMLLLLQNGFPIGKSTFTVNREAGEGLYNNFEVSSTVFLSKAQQEEVYRTFYSGTLAMVRALDKYAGIEVTKVNIGTRANKMDVLQFSKNADKSEWVDPIAVQLPGYPGDAKGQQIVIYNKTHVEKGLRYRNGALVK